VNAAQKGEPLLDFEGAWALTERFVTLGQEKRLDELTVSERLGITWALGLAGGIAHGRAEKP
jgi:hypothetical protein